MVTVTTNFSLIKYCSKCKTWKLVENFHKNKEHKDGLQMYCKLCCCITQKQYYKNNYEKVITRRKQYCENNKEKVAIAKKRWAKNNLDRCITANRKYKQSFAGKSMLKRARIKRYSTQKGRLGHRISTAICNSLKRAGSSKNGCHWETIVGYTVDKLKQHLESLFTEGMDWGNYGHGKDKWCIDHKRPIASFNYDNPNHKDFKKCWALKNLQPMWCSENFSKCAKLNWRG